MNTTLCFFMFITLTFAGRTFAKEETIAIISNDENKDIYTLVANVDEDSDSILAFYKDEFLNGKKNARQYLSVENLSSAGLVLEERQGLTVISLKSENFNLEQGGIVTMDTLYNGMNGKRKEYDLHLAKSPEGWKLFHGKKSISKLHIVINKKFLLGAIGIKDIVMK